MVYHLFIAHGRLVVGLSEWTSMAGAQVLDQPWATCCNWAIFRPTPALPFDVDFFSQVNQTDGYRPHRQLKFSLQGLGL